MQKQHMVRKIVGVYDHAGHIKLTPETEARLLIFPERRRQDLEVLAAEHPEFEHEIDGSGYLEDEGPRGPAYPLLAMRASPSVEDQLIAQEDGNDSSLAEDWADIEFPYDETAADPLTRRCDSETCNCHGGACMLAGHIKAHNGKPSVMRPAKFIRGPIPLSCAQCENF